MLTPACYTLSIKEGTYTVVSCDPKQPLPQWVLTAQGFLNITRTEEEISVVCLESAAIPTDVRQNAGWRCLKFEFKAGEKNLSMSGVLSSLAGPLAAAKISIFAISTVLTDYVLVKAEDLAHAVQVLQAVE